MLQRLKTPYFYFFLLSLGGAVAGCKNNLENSIVASVEQPSTPLRTSTPQSVLARLGENEIRQFVVPADVWAALPLKRKLFAYHMSLAVRAGQEIAWQQTSLEGSAIRRVCEIIYKAKSSIESEMDISPAKWQAFEDYFFKLLNFHGNYNPGSKMKFVPEGLSYQEVKTFVEKGASQYAMFGMYGNNLLAELERLKDDIFNPDYRKYYSVPESLGQDPIAQSGSNFYGPGFTSAHYDRLPPEIQSDPFVYPELNKVDPENGPVEFQRMQIGGRHNDALIQVNRHLADAEAYASSEEKALLRALRKHNVTGLKEDFDAANRLWVQHRPTDIAFSIGNIETYGDPKGIRADWHGWVALLDTSAETRARAQTLEDYGMVFEQKMPVDQLYRRTTSKSVPFTANIFLLAAGGAAGENTFLGENLPNDGALQTEFGSLNFSFLNVLENLGTVGGADAASWKAFVHPDYHDAYARLDIRRSVVTQVEFHEALGHGSGQNAPGVDDQTVEKNLGALYSPIEECRAETASLYHLLDSDFLLTVPNFFPERFTQQQASELAQLTVVRFFTRAIYEYRSLPADAKAITQAHRRARQLMLNYLIAKKALAIVMTQEGVPVVKLLMEPFELRRVLGELWRRIQYIRSNADAEGARAILREYDGYTDEHRAWRAAIDAKAAAMNMFKYRAYLAPEMELIPHSGKPVDVKLHYLASDTQQASPAAAEAARSAIVEHFFQRQIDTTSLERLVYCESAALSE